MTWKGSLNGLNPRHVNLPVELQDAIRSGEPVEYSFYERFKNSYSSKRLKVRFVCASCGNSHVSDFKQLNKRKRITEAYCPKCVMGVVTSDPEWRKLNSDAQKVAQKRSDVKEKNANGVSRFWKNNPDRLKTMREKVHAAQRQPETLAKYRARVGHSGRGISGKYHSKWGWLSFDSSYELAFLLHLESRDDVAHVERGPIIPYDFEGAQREYHMDYTVRWTNGEVTWNEVKSNYIGKLRDKRGRLRSKILASIAAATQVTSCKIALITDKSAKEKFGFTMPRSSYRTRMLRDVASSVIWQNPKDKEKYG